MKTSSQPFGSPGCGAEAPWSWPPAAEAGNGARRAPGAARRSAVTVMTVRQRQRADGDRGARPHHALSDRRAAPASRSILPARLRRGLARSRPGRLYPHRRRPYQAAHIDSAKAAFAIAERPMPRSPRAHQAERHAGLVKIDAVQQAGQRRHPGPLKRARPRSPRKAALDKTRIDLDYTRPQVADLRAHRTLGGDAGRAGHRQPGAGARRRAAARPDLRRPHPVQRRRCGCCGDRRRPPQAGAKGEVPVKLILRDGGEYAVEGRWRSPRSRWTGTGSVTCARFPTRTACCCRACTCAPPRGGAQRGHPGAAAGADATRRNALRVVVNAGRKACVRCGGAIARLGLGGDRRPRGRRAHDRRRPAEGPPRW